MLKQFGFRPKMYYLCLTKEKRALDTRVLSSFLAKNLTYKGGFTLDVEKNTSEILFFLGVSVDFLGQVVAIVADVERLEVKIYLFFWGADLTFQGSSQVKVVRGQGSNVKVPHLALQGVSKVFVLIENAMYRTLLATCGSANNRCLYLIYNRVFCGVILQ